MARDKRVTSTLTGKVVSGSNPKRMKLKFVEEVFGMVKSKTQTKQVGKPTRKY